MGAIPTSEERAGIEADREIVTGVSVAIEGEGIGAGGFDAGGCLKEREADGGGFDDEADAGMVAGGGIVSEEDVRGAGFEIQREIEGSGGSAGQGGIEEGSGEGEAAAGLMAGSEIESVPGGEVRRESEIESGAVFGGTGSGRRLRFGERRAGNLSGNVGDGADAEGADESAAAPGVAFQEGFFLRRPGGFPEDVLTAELDEVLRAAELVTAKTAEEGEWPVALGEEAAGGAFAHQE